MKVLLTGAGSGIGQAVADALHQRGDDLVLLARSDQRAADLTKAYAGADVRVADLARPETVAGAVESIDRLDAVVHAAGVVELGPLADQPLQHVTEQVTVNLVAPAELTRAVLPAIRSAGGTVVFLNSGAGLVAHPEWSAYAASKFGLRAIADSLRAEEVAGGTGVRMTSVYLGRIATPMQQKVHEQEGKTYDASDWATPGAVAATILHVLDLPRDVTIADVTVRPGPH
jgi:NADP-dependent 3-hydroxy acid dehydrogenase YdfG